jgi:hypothetical protein
MASRALGVGLIVFLSFMTWQSTASAEQAEIICRDGVKDTVPLIPVRNGTPGALESTEVYLGPVETVWIALPSGASISRSQTVPVPVRRTDARRLEMLLDFKDGRTEFRAVDASRRSAQGLTEVQVIQTRIEPRAYGLPEGCRVMTPHESRNYALALLNNAGCLLPSDVHAALAEIPAPRRLGAMLRDCGWEPDISAAVHALEQAADRGSVQAGWVLAQIYLGDVVPGYQNLPRAFVRMEVAGDSGHVSADFMSAVMQWQGIGTVRDPVAAFAALLPYAKRGSHEAQGLIGMMYLTGEGAPLNNVHAYAWCHVAESGQVLVYSDPGACRQVAEARMSSVQVQAALDLSVQIRNGEY